MYTFEVTDKNEVKSTQVDTSTLTHEYILKVLKEEFHEVYSPRPQQMEVFNVMSKWIYTYFKEGLEACKYLVVDAPTGVGKSLLAVSMLKALRRIAQELDYELTQVFLITERKLLQDQYATDFPKDLFNLKGLDNYSCYFDVGKSCAESRCGRIGNKKGEEKMFPEVCSKACGYDEAIKRSITEPVILTNSAKYININKYHIGRLYQDPALVLYDEGHNVENLLDSEATLDLSTKVFERLGLDMQEYFKGTMQTTPIENLIPGLDNLKSRLALIMSIEENADPDKRDAKRIRLIENLLSKIRDLLENPDNYVLLFDMDHQKNTVTLNFKCKFVHKAFREMFRFPTVFLSATMLSKAGFQTMTGLRDDEIEWISVGTPFKKEKRPVLNYWYPGAKALNYNNMSSEFPNVILRTKTLLIKHANERGIIHAQSYKNAEWLMQDLSKEFGNRLIFPKSAREQKDALERLKSIPNGVLISPSMTEGVDLKGDLARFVILVKVPYLRTVDPVVSLRMRTLQNWYEYKTCMTLVQAVGRGVRNEEDYATTYLLDPEFLKFYGRARHLLPEWFKEAWDTFTCGPV